MQKRLMTAAKATATLSLIALAVAGCLDNGTGADNPNSAQAPETPALSTVVNGFVQNAKSLTGIDGVTVTVAEADQAKVLPDEDGDFTFLAEDGAVSFALKESVTPTETSPVTLTLITSAGADYVASSTLVELTSPGTHDFNVNMVAINDPPAGVQAARKSLSDATDATGTTSSAVTAGSSNSGGAEAEVSLPAATTITDSNGTPLSGDISVDVAHVDGSSDEAIDVFPGGLAATVTNPDTYNAANPDNPIDESNEGNLISASLTSITVTDADGTAGHHFSVADPSVNPLTIKATVDPATVNPLTGEAIKAGDTLSIFSYENESGVWTFEANGTVVDESGVLFVTFTTNHLSYYNLGWWGGAKCNNVKLNLVNGGAKRLRVRIKRVGGGYTRTVFYKGAGDVITLNNAPKNMRVNLVVDDAVTHVPRTVIAGIPINNLCAEPKQHTVTLDPDELLTATLTATVQSICWNAPPRPAPLPSASVYVTQNGRLINSGTTDGNGVALIGGLYVGQTYRVRAMNNVSHKNDAAFVTVTNLTPSVTLQIHRVFCRPATGGTGGDGGNEF